MADTQIIALPSGEEVEFPASMSDDQIRAVMKRKFAPQPYSDAFKQKITALQQQSTRNAGLDQKVSEQVPSASAIMSANAPWRAPINKPYDLTSVLKEEVGGGIKDAAISLGGLAKHLLSPPHSAGDYASTLSGPMGLVAKRMLLDPQVSLADKAKSAAATGNSGDALAYSAEAAVPVVGPLLDMVRNSDPLHATRTATNLATQYMTGRAAEGIVGDMTRPGAPVNPRTIAPNQVEALASALPRSQKLDNYSIAQNALPELRQATKDLGGYQKALEDAKAANPNVPESVAQINVAGDILKKSLDKVQAESSQVIAPYRNYTTSAQPIADSLKKYQDSLPANATGERATVQAEIDKFDGKRMTIDELDKQRILLNKQLDSFFNRTTEGQIASPVAQQVARISRREIANRIYDDVQGLSGQDLRGLKQREHGIIDLQGQMTKAANTAKAKQAQASGGRNAFQQTIFQLRGRGMQAIEKNNIVDRFIGVSPAEEFGGAIKRAVGDVKP